MHQFLGPRAFQSILPIQQDEAIQVVNDLLDDPLVCLPSLEDLLPLLMLVG